MMRAGGRALWACWIAAAIFVAGCAGKQILDLNGELIQAQQHKTNLERELAAASGGNRDTVVLKLVQVSEQFQQIADAAYEQAAPAADVRAKISYYRIAAVADWQRGSDRALVAAREGTQACNTSNGFGIAPRDCTILLAIPHLLVNDLWVTRLNKPGGIDPAAPDFVARGREAMAGLVQAYNGLASALARASGTVPAELVQVLQRQQQRIKESVENLGIIILSRLRRGDPAGVELCAFVRSEAPAIVPSSCPR